MGNDTQKDGREVSGFEGDTAILHLPRRDVINTLLLYCTLTEVRSKCLGLLSASSGSCQILYRLSKCLWDK